MWKSPIYSARKGRKDIQASHQDSPVAFAHIRAPAHLRSHLSILSTYKVTDIEREASLLSSQDVHSWDIGVRSEKRKGGIESRSESIYIFIA